MNKITFLCLAFYPDISTSQQLKIDSELENLDSGVTLQYLLTTNGLWCIDGVIVQQSTVT